MHFLLFGRSVGLEKKNHKKSRKRRPWYPRMTLEVNIYILGLTKCTIYCKKLFLFSSMLFLCSFFRLKELFQVKNGLTTSLLLVLKMLKIWVGRTTLNGEKKRGWPNENLNGAISIKRIEPNRNLTSAEADEFHGVAIFRKETFFFFLFNFRMSLFERFRSKT